MPEVGELFEDRIVSEIYTGIETDDYSEAWAAPWTHLGYDILNVAIVDTILPISTAFWFYDMRQLTDMDISKLDTSNTINMSSMFSCCSSLTALNLSNFNTTKVISMSEMFTECFSLTELDLSGFDTSNVENMEGMFYSCESLTALNLSNFNTSKVTNMYDMFDYCESLTELDLSSFDTSSVKYMQYMFYGCKSLTELDLSNFDTSNVEDMEWIFCECEELTNINLSNFNTSKVINMRGMFDSCYSLTALDLSSFDTSNVTDMMYMFCLCESLATLDLSNFDTSNVENMDSMFSDCAALTTIYVSDTWTAQNASGIDMFDSCVNLDGAVPYNSNNTSAEMANYETGYLTLKATKPEEPDTPVISGGRVSKINLDGTIYNLKDASAQNNIAQILNTIDGLGTASQKDCTDSVDNDDKLATGSAIVNYVGERISGVKAFEYEIVSTLPTASESTMHKIYLVRDAFGTMEDGYEEWITIKTGSTYSFEKISDTNIGLEGYVPTYRTVAGLALSDDISVTALQNALGLGELAYKNSIIGTVHAVTGVSDIEYTPAGEVAVTLKHTDVEVSSVGKYTPDGIVTGKTTAAGDVNVALEQTATQAVLTKSDYTPAGQVSVELNGDKFNAISSVGTQAVYTEGAFTAATLTHSTNKLALEGLTASVDENREALVLSAANKASASLINAFSGGSKSQNTFVPNSLPTMASQTVEVQSATFVGTTAKDLLTTAVSYNRASVASATFTGKQSDIIAAFTGKEGNLSVKGNYDKASVDTATFAGTAATLKHSVTKEDIAAILNIN